MSSSRTFVLGDIHGAYRALRQCLDRSGFDKDTDHLIFLGDVCDGWPETSACIDELLTIKNLTFLLGNHDFWTLEWMKSGKADEVWMTQGGRATMNSYQDGIPESHINLLESAVPYYLLGNRVFVHAGFNTQFPIQTQSVETLLWDRNLARIAIDFYMSGFFGKLTPYEEVFLGHTPIPFPEPIQSSEIWLMDTGAGWSGVLSMMDINTKKVFTSDNVPSLYPGIEGRRKF